MPNILSKEFAPPSSEAFPYWYAYNIMHHLPPLFKELVVAICKDVINQKKQ